MASTGHRSSTSRRDPTDVARRQRDVGLERGRSISKGIAAASVVAVAATGVYLSQALPGHSASTSTGTSGNTGAVTPSSPSAGSSSAGSSADAGSGISAPAAVPAPAYQQAPVSSGAS